MPGRCKRTLNWNRQPADEFRTKLEETCTIVLDELKEKPDSFKALFLAGFVADLASGVIPAPAALEEAVSKLNSLQETMGQTAFWQTASSHGLASLLVGF